MPSASRSSTLASATNSKEPLHADQDSKSGKSGSRKMSRQSSTKTSRSSDHRSTNGKRLIWRDIYAEVKEPVPWYQMCCTRPEQETRVVLDQISGFADPGQVTFLMGSSGAGKTTLLNILTQRARGLRIYGEVQVNSHVLKPGEMRKMSAFVPQEDIFIGALTVKETLMMAARLRMPAKTSAAERKERVDEVAKDMGLKEIMTTRIGCRFEKSISLGEKKRLSFACEILTDPSILFCDEPTSGLDAFMALQVMVSLCELAKEGKTIVCSIHQPSSPVFHMADWLVLISKGQVAYQGPIREVQSFFTRCGLPCPQYIAVADHFMKVLSPGGMREEGGEEDYDKRMEAIFAAYNASEYSRHVHNETHKHDTSSARARMRLEVNKTREYAAGWLVQYVWLVWRGVKIVLRNPMVIRLRLFQCLVVSVLEGLVYFRLKLTADTILTGRGLAFEIVRTMNILFLMPSIQILTSELPIVYRDYQAGIYSPSAYFFGKQTADGIQYVLLPIIHTTILYLMAGLDRTVVQYSWLLLVSILEAFVATSVGYAGACIFGELSMAALVVPMFSIPMLIFGGLFINFDSIHYIFKPFTYLSWYRYGYEVSLSAIFRSHQGDIPGCRLSDWTNGTNPQCDGFTGPENLMAWGVDSDYAWLNVLAILLFVIAWRGLALFALTFRVRRA